MWLERRRNRKQKKEQTSGQDKLPNETQTMRQNRETESERVEREEVGKKARGDAGQRANEQAEERAKA